MVSVATAYKGERVRNSEFESKLNGALKQIERRDEVTNNVENLKAKNRIKGAKVKALQDEAGKEKMYSAAISRQEAVVYRLEGILE